MPDPAAIVKSVVDPELPFLTVADLGILRDVWEEESGAIVVEITPTYSGCPAMGTIRRDLVQKLRHAGYDRVDVRTVLHPPWTSDWITAAGKRKLAQHGISPPGAAAGIPDAGVPIQLQLRRSNEACPQCGSLDTVELSTFGSTACKSLERCRACGEPFERFKEI